MAATTPADARLAADMYRYSPYARGRRALAWMWDRPIARALTRAFITIFLVTTLNFALIRLMPGNAIDAYIAQVMNEQLLSYEDAAQLASGLFNLDLDKPIHEQYLAVPRRPRARRPRHFDALAGHDGDLDHRGVPPVDAVHRRPRPAAQLHGRESFWASSPRTGAIRLFDHIVSSGGLHPELHPQLRHRAAHRRHPGNAAAPAADRRDARLVQPERPTRPSPRVHRRHPVPRGAAGARVLHRDGRPLDPEHEERDARHARGGLRHRGAGARTLRWPDHDGVRRTERRAAARLPVRDHRGSRRGRRVLHRNDPRVPGHRPAPLQVDRAARLHA